MRRALRDVFNNHKPVIPETPTERPKATPKPSRRYPGSTSFGLRSCPLPHPKALPDFVEPASRLEIISRQVPPGRSRIMLHEVSCGLSGAVPQHFRDDGAGGWATVNSVPMWQALLGVRCPNPGNGAVTPRPDAIWAVFTFVTVFGLLPLVTYFPGAPLSQRGVLAPWRYMIISQKIRYFGCRSYCYNGAYNSPLERDGPCRKLLGMMRPE